ncbi:hypothetical protein [Paenibacillus sp. FJAT-26967]|uniref:hypothetical protein n=1 Tax=Paenibacillus sp. FJAT-26967 TaxID=1729690 RepID=UPI0012E38F0B|nr:hypothetical protein [Paenibacillus sp. FJAT-26967]
MAKEIINDEQYFKTCNWLIRKAVESGDPLMSEAEKTQLLAKYDDWYAEARKYRTRT